MFPTLDINIKQIAAPLVGEPKGKKFAAVKSRFISKSKKKLSSQLNNNLDVFILAIEGAFHHVKDLDKNKIKSLLKETGEIIEDFYSLDDILSEKNYFDSQQLKEKIKLVFKVLYKFESVLHKNIYKDAPIEKTPKNVLDNISKINRNTLSKLASKNAF